MKADGGGFCLQLADHQSESLFKTTVWCPAFRLISVENTLKRGHQTNPGHVPHAENGVFKQALNPFLATVRPNSVRG